MGSDAKPIVGIDLGGTKVLSRLVDPSTGEASGRIKAKTPSGPEAVLDAVVETVEQLDGWEEAVAVGIGVPGFVADDGIVARCPNIEGWDQPVDVRRILSKRLGKPVSVGNDVNCAALGEHRLGAGVGHPNMLAAYVGTGVGGGIIVNDRLLVGPRGMAGEIGHMTVVPEGRPCGCGELGHLEAYAGRAGIEAEVRRRVEAGSTEYLAEQAGDGAIRSKHLAAGLDAGDETTIELLADGAEALAQVLGNVATLLDLPRVVLGGGVVDKLGEPFIEQIVACEGFGGFGSAHVELVPADRMDDSVVVGAALLAVHDGEYES